MFLMTTPQTIPYGRQSVDKDDIAAVADVMRSNWLTTGPKIPEFEKAVADYCGAVHGVAVSSGTAALHAAMHAIDIGPGDEVIVPAMTFAATANCVVYQGGTPVFADVEADTLRLDPANVLQKITPRTKAIIAMDYAGQSCDYDSLREIARRHGLFLVADACHALGAEYKGHKTGTLADLTVFSFHPVKHITTGEGGMIITDHADFASRMRIFRNHGITTDHRQREATGAWQYEMAELGYNYRITDIQCALGISQLKKLPNWIKRRQEVAASYDQAFSGTDIHPLVRRGQLSHAYHLYVVRVANRDRVFEKMRAAGIGVNVHYLPVYLHPYYRQNYDIADNLCLAAEKAYKIILSLPLYPGMRERDVSRVVSTLNEALRGV